MDISKKLNLGTLIFVAPVMVFVFVFIFINFYSDNTSVIAKNENTIEGRSMEPTLVDGQKVNLDIYKELTIGDVIIFKCFSKCDRDGVEIVLVKRLIEINEQGCYWIEGDNKNHSYDSRNYGWLCSEDVFIGGVVML